MQYFTIAKHNLQFIGSMWGVWVVQIGTQYIITVCQNNISNRASVASCGKINANRASIAN